MLLRQFGLLGLSILASVRAETSTTETSTTASASKSSSASSASDSSSATSSSTTTSKSAAATHVVSVGADGLNYTPRSLTANVGDIIEFRFYPLNHSVARAEYKQPCIPYEDTGAGKVGFWSGFEPISIVTNDPPMYNLLINDTEPIFFYCSAPGACQDGMIGVINPNTTQTFDVQFAYAENSTMEFSPNEYFPLETSKPVAGTDSHKPFPPGAIAGIVISAVAVIALAGALFYMCGRHRTMKEVLHNGSAGPQTNDAFDNNHNSYMSQGGKSVSEVNYRSMSKFSSGLSGLDTASGRFSPHYGAYTDPDANSFRSRSPPMDEVGMQTVRNGQYQSVSVGSPLGSPGFPNRAYNHDSHSSVQQYGGSTLSEMDDRSAQDVLRMQGKEIQNQGKGPIELPVPSRSASMIAGAPSPERERPFSYTDSESGYAGMMRSNVEITR
ncbi:c12dab74-874d-4bee-8431-555e9fafc929 [Sclerotinia trifoliorum]|uniref:C12dab74-874d-4bee-8431-555e9fafc929 n=1 Tax=Sclerotinia trifoliorum TaxID=28548 RepID=A0A8H2W5S6_9HELO|nr:c12dab74-874d-4bee-8431-555e9fafc929 [Sclerotinia trifoliorum]